MGLVWHSSAILTLSTRQASIYHHENLSRVLNNTNNQRPALTLKGPENLLIVPSQIENMYVTKITIVPSAVILVLSSIVLCLTILIHFKRVLKLYLGLVFYSITEVTLFLQILLFYLLSFFNKLPDIPCGLTKSIGLLTMTLPLVAILLITITRLIFVKYPFHYRNILRIKYQLVCCFLAICFAILLSIWPALGVCEAYYSREYGICLLQSNKVCSGYVGLYIILGIVTPTIIVIGIYAYVYHVLKQHRARRTSRTASQIKSHNRHSKDISSEDKNKLSGSTRTFGFMSRSEVLEEPKEERKENTDPIPRIMVTEHDTDITIVNRVAVVLDEAASISITTNLVITRKKSGDNSTLASSTSDLLSPKGLHELHLRKEKTKLPEMKSRLRPYLAEAVRKLSLLHYGSEILQKKREIPWSLVLLTLIHITSSLPWIYLEFYSQSTFEANKYELFLADMGNAILVTSVGVSPLLYILFTRLIRDKVFHTLRKITQTTVTTLRPSKDTPKQSENNKLDS